MHTCGRFPYLLPEEIATGERQIVVISGLLGYIATHKDEVHSGA
jgi:hypothetical protein